MKPFTSNLMRRAQAVLTTGLLLGGMVAATAQSLPPQPNQYRLQSNYVSGTVAPYNAGGGIPAQSYITSQTYTSSNCTLRWYGMNGYYTVLGATSPLGPWYALTNVASSTFGAQAALSIPNTTNNYSFFQLSQTNSFAGADQCSSCHGDKYTRWSGTAHGTAIKEILNPDGSFVAGRSQSCLPCHTVGMNQPTGYTYVTNAGAANYSSYLANVGCETCHGPAGWHKNGDHALIDPVVSMDPSICGSCHQGATHPTFQEYTNLNATALSNAPLGVLVTGVNHNGGGHNSFGCAFCHNAVNRQTMINEYYDKQAGNAHPVTILTGSTPTWTATCATCHDPHTSNYVAQLRYPTYSTNYYCMPTVTDVRSVVVTNYNGTYTTNSVNMNTVFDAIYNPKVQVCAQCHSGGRGMRWDGTAYGLVTNLVASGPVTNLVYIDITTNITFTQVFTNTVPFTTNSYNYTYVVGRYATNVVTLNQTNPVIGVGVVTPLIAYTNAGTVYYSTNSSGFSVPHYPVQYNILIGQADFDYASNGVPNKTHAHTSAPDQCATCHVPNYATGAHSNNTGHSFVMDYNGCLSSCHSSYTPTSLAAKVLNQKITQSNSIARVVSLLNQWGTYASPAILRTNYGPLAWEFPSIGALSKKVTNNGVIYASGPPSAYKPSLGAVPAGTNDNLQLSVVPQDIWKARFSLYVIYEDQSLGVHNPTYVSALLADAETRVLNQIAQSGYSANFGAKTPSGFAPLSVAFTNGAGISTYSWNFGDGGSDTVSNPTHVYNAPGLYSVTFTADGQPLTRSQYIWVLAKPAVSFTADNTAVAVGTTVNFSNTSSNTNSVFRWTWSPMFGVSGAPTFDTDGGPLSFTYTNAGTYSVTLRASCPGGSANRVTVTNTAYITVH